MDSKLRQQFNIGDKVFVDNKFENYVTVISQTPKFLFTTVEAPNGYSWTVMTNRLTKIS